MRKNGTVASSIRLWALLKGGKWSFIILPCVCGKARVPQACAAVCRWPNMKVKREEKRHKCYISCNFTSPGCREESWGSGVEVIYYIIIETEPLKKRNKGGIMRKGQMPLGQECCQNSLILNFELNYEVSTLKLYLPKGAYHLNFGHAFV